jgi:hypothetical protein
MHKIEEGNLKIQMVFDWSVSAGLLVNKCYKYFCNWGKHLNIDETYTAVENPLLQSY